MLLQMRIWAHHHVGKTPGFADLRQALGAIRARVLQMPSETHL
jgi:hypothetical protein